MASALEKTYVNASGRIWFPAPNLNSSHGVQKRTDLTFKSMSQSREVCILRNDPGRRRYLNRSRVNANPVRSSHVVPMSGKVIDGTERLRFHVSRVWSTRWQSNEKPRNERDMLTGRLQLVPWNSKEQITQPCHGCDHGFWKGWINCSQTVQPSRFCLKISNPDQYAVGMGKIPILTFASSNKKPRKIFSSNSNSIDIFRRPNQNNGASGKQTDEMNRT